MSSRLDSLAGSADVYEVCLWRQVNDREAEIDLHIVPIEDMYALMARYEVRAHLHIL